MRESYDEEDIFIIKFGFSVVYVINNENEKKQLGRWISGSSAYDYMDRNVHKRDRNAHIPDEKNPSGKTTFYYAAYVESAQQHIQDPKVYEATKICIEKYDDDFYMTDQIIIDIAESFETMQ
ncbi:MAG: hypothetical protein FWG14_03530 [Peptococcaceae bacterium]|nr:hypothetical protein [Peptococcaceae bacterium]